jgi:hypothetical protein
MDRTMPPRDPNNDDDEDEQVARRTADSAAGGTQLIRDMSLANPLRGAPRRDRVAVITERTHTPHLNAASDPVPEA